MKNEQQTILIVDDTPANLQLLGNILTEAGVGILVANNGFDALSILEKRKPDLILLDIMMPGLDGYQVCKRIKANEAWKDIPIIFVSALSSPHEQIQGFLDGGVDYITKPFYPEEVLARVRTHLKLSMEIESRKSAEQEGEFSKTLLRKAQQLAHIGSWVWFLKENRVEWSDELCALLGLPFDESTADFNELIGRVVHPQDKERVLSESQKAISTNELEALEYRIVWPNGEIRTVMAVPGELVKDEEGKPAYVSGFVQDITEIHEMRQELQKKNHLNQMVLQTAMDGFLLLNRQGYIREVNPSFCQLVGGVQAEKLCGAALSEFIPAEQQEQWAQRIQQILTEKQLGFEMELQSKHGEVYEVEVSAKYLENVDSFIVMFVHDVTNKRMATKREAELQAQYIQHQKMESVGRLADGLAHDFNNALSVIRGHTELILGQSELDKTMRDDLGEILKATNRSAEITRQLLAFTRKQESSPVPLHLNQYLGNFLQLLARIIGEDVFVKLNSKPDIWQICMDPCQLDQVLAELCVNARDAMDGVGTVHLDAFNTHLNEEFCETQPELVPGDYVRISISDTGSGLQKDQQTKIFEPFSVIHGYEKRTGLGMAAVMGIVSQNKGCIRVYSEQGLGTTFSIYLPRYYSEGERELEKELPPRLIERGYGKILVCEDEPAILKMAGTLLTRQGYEVLFSSTPSEAINLALQYEGEIRLLLADVVMPEMNGLLLFEKLQSLIPSLRYVLMSGYPVDLLSSRGILDPRINFLQKPFSPDTLYLKIQDVLST